MRETLQKMRAELRPFLGAREAEAVIRLIFRKLKGWDTVAMIMHEDDALSPFVKGEIEGIMERMKRHEPVQYILGEARFHGLDFKVGPGVLVPRPETSELVDLITGRYGGVADLRVLDICTGSGCIAVALARTLPFAKVEAIDISPLALAYAAENVKTLKADVGLVQADLFSWTPEAGVFDVMVSNPPYVDDSERVGMEPGVLDWEPHEALFVPDADPLLFYRRIAAIGMEGLKEGGTLWLEINPRHAAEMEALLCKCGYMDVEIKRDSYGKNRFAAAQKPVLE